LRAIWPPDAEGPTELVEGLLPLLAAAAVAQHGRDTLLRDADRREASFDHVAKTNGDGMAGAFPVIIARGVAGQSQAHRAAAVFAVHWDELAFHVAVHQMERFVATL
jgi:Mrp family chromosome partitioning ATPase